MSNVNNEKVSTTPTALVMIGGNTGGPAALSQIISKLPSDIPACVLVMQQMRSGFTKLLAEHLRSISRIDVREAENGELLTSGKVLVIPGGHSAHIAKYESFKGREFHLELEDISASPEMQRSKIDRLMQSGVEMFGPSTIGVLLSGIGDDGREGLRAIRGAGGTTIVQNEASSVLFDMPRAAIDAEVVDHILPLYSVADRLIKVVGENHAEFLQKAAG